MTAAQELEFYIDRYIDLYKENSDLLNLMPILAYILVQKIQQKMK